MKATPVTRQRTLAARSFNMERLQAVQMFALPLPQRLVMPITFIATGSSLTDSMVREFLRARQLMNAVFASGDLDPVKFGLTAKIEPIILPDLNPTNLIRFHLPAVWSYQDFYLQASFFDWHKVTSAIPYHATSTAQTFYDIMCDRSGSLDPALHQPIQQSLRQVRELNLTIGGFYEAEIGVWRRDLLEYRTAVLVMLRAAWMGRSPIQEYRNFGSAGGGYFIEYPILCP